MTDIDFEQLKEAGFVVVDYPARKLAVYPNINGHVVLACEEDGQSACVLIDPDEISKVCAALLQAGIKAKPIADGLSAEYTAHSVIGKAMDGAA